MSMMRLAMQNVRSSFKNYLSVVLSLSFSILVLLNFQNIIYSDVFDGLGGQSKEYIDTLIRVISFVLCCFMFFFLWYATNVFLTKRKREIGIYIFMGLSHQKIGMLYMLETTMIGLSALLIGTVCGVLFTQLFQMILLAVSDIAVEISFDFSYQPLFITAGIYLAMYIIFVIKGYRNIVRSSVMDLVSAARQNEYVRQNKRLLWIKAALGIVILTAGYYLAVKEGGQEVMGNVFAAVVLVVVGIYFLFGGFLPLIFQSMAEKKLFLYQKERSLWINHVIFRMKKNYRTYAITCVMMLCSVTALATGAAMKFRYDAMVHFRNTYTFQLLSNQNNLYETARSLIEKENSIAYDSEISILQMDSDLVKTRLFHDNYAFLSFSQVKRLAENTGLEFEYEPLEDDEILEASHLYLLSLMTDRSGEMVTINGKSYRQTDETNVPYLGYLQEQMSFYILSDAEYERLLPLGEELYTYNYRIEDIFRFRESSDDLDTIVSNTDQNYTAKVTIDPNSSDIEWIKVLYTVCIFMFLVFVLAGGSILFMKLYNDAFEEKERYQVLKKLGIAERTLKKSLARELLTAYAMPFLVTAVSAYFSVHALEQMMHSSLMPIYLGSLGVMFFVFFISYRCSVMVYAKHAGVTSV